VVRPLGNPQEEPLLPLGSHRRGQRRCDDPMRWQPKSQNRCSLVIRRLDLATLDKMPALKRLEQQQGLSPGNSTTTSLMSATSEDTGYFPKVESPGIPNIRPFRRVRAGSGRWDSSSGASTTGSEEVAERNARREERRTSRKGLRRVSALSCYPGSRLCALTLLSFILRYMRVRTCVI
jgi:hypothetical protein